MARLVDPVEARKGQFIKSFPIGETYQLDGYMATQEKLLRQLGLSHKEIVYTKIVAWGAKNNRNDTWQIYVTDKTSPGREP